MTEPDVEQVWLERRRSVDARRRATRVGLRPRAHRRRRRVRDDQGRRRRPVRHPPHLDRLRRSAAGLGLRIPFDDDALRAAMAEVLAAHGLPLGAAPHHRDRRARAARLRARRGRRHGRRGRRRRSRTPTPTAAVCVVPGRATSAAPWRAQDDVLRRERGGARLRQGARLHRGALREHHRPPVRGHRLQRLRRHRRPPPHAAALVRLPGRRHPRARARGHRRRRGGHPDGRVPRRRRGLPHQHRPRRPARPPRRRPRLRPRPAHQGGRRGVRGAGRSPTTPDPPPGASAVFTRPPTSPTRRSASSLAEHWGIDATALGYEPVGFGAHHWRASTRTRLARFLTVHDLTAHRNDDTETEDGVFRRLTASFSAARALQRRRRRLRAGPHPHRATDASPTASTSGSRSPSTRSSPGARRARSGRFASPADRLAVLDLVIEVHRHTDLAAPVRRRGRPRRPPRRARSLSRSTSSPRRGTPVPTPRAPERTSRSTRRRAAAARAVRAARRGGPPAPRRGGAHPRRAARRQRLRRRRPAPPHRLGHRPPRRARAGPLAPRSR